MAFAFYKWIIILQLATQGSSQFLCPPAEIGSTVELICNHSNYSSIFFNTPRGPTAVACTPTCSDASRFTGSNINETQTRLTILKVEHRDRGTWTCQYGGEEEVVQCKLNLYKIPSCKISSDQDTNCLTLGQEITLYLNVNNTYCDEDNKLTMTSGDEVHIFTGQPGVNFSETFNTSYIVTDKHLGPVSSKFQCGNQILNISCSGVTNLQSETATCEITSDTDTSNLEIGDNITLSLTVNNTCCKENKTTSLITGNLVNSSTEQSDENITLIVVYQFTITVNHLGPVASTFQCGDQLYKLNCDGVRTLKLDPPTCKITNDTDTSNLEIGEDITLSLTVNNTYCTENKTTSLTTGKVVHRSPEQSDENITEIVVYKFTITANHLGPIESIFQCGDQLYTLNCDGVRTLKLAASDGNPREVTAAWIVPVAATLGVIVAAVVVVAVVVVVRRKRNPEKDKMKDLIPLPRGGTNLANEAYTYASINDNPKIDDTTTFNSQQGNKEPGKTSMADKKFTSSSMNDYQDIAVVSGPVLQQQIRHQGNKEPEKADVTDVNPYAMTPLNVQADQYPAYRDKKADISDNKETATKTSPETLYAVVNKKNK